MANYILSSFKGGISEYENAGLPGCFKYGVNLNIRRRSDTLTCNQALYDLTAPAQGFTNLVDWWVPSSDGNIYGFARDGRIYKISSTLTVTLVYTDTDGAILGAGEWGLSNGKQYLWWATATKLHCKEIPGNSNWTVDKDANIVIGENTYTYPKTLTSSTNHMMKGVGGGIGGLVINNGNTLAFVGYDGSFTNEILRFTPGQEAKALTSRGNSVVIATRSKNQLYESALFSWDGMDTEDVFGFDDIRPLPLKDITAMIDTEVNLLVDEKGQVFHSDFINGLPVFTFLDSGKVSTGGVTNEEYLAYFGVWGNDSKAGIYSYGRKWKNSNIVLNFEYAIDCDEIGGIIKVGQNLLVSYKKNGTPATYGIKNIDLTKKAIGVYETIDLWQPAKTGLQSIAIWSTVVVTMAPLPLGTKVSLKYKLNKTGEWKVANLRDGGTEFTTENGQEAVFFIGDHAKVVEFQLTLTPKDNTCPEIYKIELYFDYGQ